MDEMCIKQSVLAEKLAESITRGKKTNLERRTLGFYQNKIAELQKNWTEFDSGDTKLRELIITSKKTCSHDYIVKDKYAEVEIKYYEYMGELTDGLIQKTPKEIDPTGSPGVSTVIHTSNNQNQLPRINLPKFNGEYTSWRSFHDLFVSLVHNNTQLPAVQKLHHLKGCLTGEAERLLRHVPITEEDYEPAWEKLKQRYENKRLLVNTQLKILTNQPKLTNENSKGIKSLVDTTEECMQQLKALKVNVSSWDTLLVYLLVQKLPYVTLKLWEEELGNTQELPEFERFQNFLQTRFRVLESMSQSVNIKPQVQTTKTYHVANISKCPACNGGHYVGICKKFLKLDTLSRRKCIESSGRCFNCFSNKHVANQCSSSRRCKKCEGNHHHLLHLSDVSTNYPRERVGLRKGAPGTTSSSQILCQNYTQSNGGQVVKNVEDKEETKNFFSSETHRALLATALVAVRDRRNRLVVLRCLVDPGSQTSFITDGACKRLGLQERPTKVQITGLNKSQMAWSNRQVSLQVASCKHTDEFLTVNMLIINKITDFLPSTQVEVKQWDHLRDLELADPTYWKPGPIDILLGAKVYSEILLEGLRRGPESAPIAVNTTLGWLVLGNNPESSVQRIAAFTAINQYEENLNDLLKKFWDTEEITTKPILKPEDKECEEIYNKTHCRLKNGQYEVRLPFVDEKIPTFGPSRELAMKRYNHLKRRFQNDRNLEQEYTKCMNEYIELGHMEPVDAPVEKYNDTYYIPHHAVMKESTTTKLRVVFDASAKSQKGKSLNEQLLVGPTIQPKLFSTLLKWRKYKIAMTADIEKMYRMILVHPEHRRYQRILWENSKTKGIQDYQLNTVTFGTSSVPYLAIRTLQQLAKDEEHNWPLASKAAFYDFYVDDLLTGADTVDEAKELQRQYIKMLKSGGFNLRKWASNNSIVLTNVPIEHREVKSVLKFDELENIKTLGIRWYPGSDFFSFSISLKHSNNIITKRSILSEVASLYDPLGWISPVIIVAKLLIQTLWITGCSWDSEVDQNIRTQWQNFRERLKILETLKIPRWVGTTKECTNIQIHGFCDASIKAYAAVVYIRVQDSDGVVTSTMLTSKTKVAPLKPLTLPRLELNGALILSRLIKSTIQDMQLTSVPIIAWSDSTITLQWIRSHPARWKTYVANRVVEIQDIIDPNNWRYVPTKHNPADIASRGIPADELVNNELWWHGPEWLTKESDCWPESMISANEPQIELKKLPCMVFHSQIKHELFLRYSSFTKLTRVVALIKRFAHNCRKSVVKRRDPLSPEELEVACTLIIKLIQQEMLPEDYTALKTNKPLSRKSRLLSLNPFLDHNEVIRVGGRLDNANITYNRKHPIILPNNHHITDIIIDHLHNESLHGGVGLVLNTSRDLYWILDGKRAISRRINNCKTCVTHRQRVRSQLMGSLPTPRVNISKPFSHVGIDYAGPISLKTSPHRTARIFKGYFCSYVCMATKAIHLELVSDLTSAAFIAAFKRFVSRRGLCTDIYSDCGTNFKGAENSLSKDLAEAIKGASPEIVQYLSSKKITWHFNPPASPHFGGLWEAGVKSVKYHLRRVIGKSIYTFEEYATLLTQIEACVNSRPLCAIGNHVEDLEVLTPGHFLIGQALNAVPEAEICYQNTTHTKRWKHIQFMTQQFWSKWSKDYLNRLQQRPKWRGAQPNIKVGDVVLLKIENTSPTYWPLGKIEEVFPGADGLVRVVQVRTSTNSFRRPIVKISRLPIQSTEINERE